MILSCLGKGVGRETLDTFLQFRGTSPAKIYLLFTPLGFFIAAKKKFISNFLPHTGPLRPKGKEECLARQGKHWPHP